MVLPLSCIKWQMRYFFAQYPADMTISYMTSQAVLLKLANKSQAVWDCFAHTVVTRMVLLCTKPFQMWNYLAQSLNQNDTSLHKIPISTTLFWGSKSQPEWYFFAQNSLQYDTILSKPQPAWYFFALNSHQFDTILSKSLPEWYFFEQNPTIMMLLWAKLQSVWYLLSKNTIWRLYAQSHSRYDACLKKIPRQYDTPLSKTPTSMYFFELPPPPPPPMWYVFEQNPNQCETLREKSLLVRYFYAQNPSKYDILEQNPQPVWYFLSNNPQPIWYILSKIPTSPILLST